MMIPYALNLLDLAFTLYALQHGGVELNPLMRCVPIMIAYKTVIVGALCYVLKRVANTENVLARLGLWVIFAVYAGLNIWHIVNIF